MGGIVNTGFLPCAKDAQYLGWIVWDYEGKMPSLLLPRFGRGCRKGDFVRNLGVIAFLWWGILGDGGGSWVEIV